MPLLRKRPFVKQKPPLDLSLDEEVFHCTLTNEIFRDYEKFFERIILCNSLVWTCAITGRPSLTYQEALESEGRARKQLASFPEHLQMVVLYLATLTHRSRLTDINDDVFMFVKDRFFVNEVIDAMVEGQSQRKVCRVIKVISPDADKNDSTAMETNDSDDDVICLDDPAPTKKKAKGASVLEKSDPSQYQYVLQELKKPNIYVLQAPQLSRKKGLLTRDKCKLYLKQHCDPSQDGIWRVKPKYSKKFKLSTVKFEDFCGGSAPRFAVSNAKRKPSSNPLGPCSSLVDLTDEDSLIRKAKREQKDRGDKKLGKSDSNIANLEDQLTWMRTDIQEREVLREKLRVERLARLEEMKRTKNEERQRLREEKAKEREQMRVERLEREATLREWSRPRDDMECDDLKDLPVPTRIEGLIASEQFGDAVMVLEFLQCFSTLLEVDDTFPHGVSFEEFAKALRESAVNGLFNDLLSFLLTSIFSMQEQEESEEKQYVTHEDSMRKDFGDCKNISYDELVKQATVASQWPQNNYGTSLRNLPLDGFTLSEVLRLHFLSSGAKAMPGNVKFHYQQRGGYTPLDDAGLEFRQNEAAILKSLAHNSIYEMTVKEKLKVMQALIQQLLTYVTMRDVVEDSHDKLRQLRNELRQYQWAAQRRDREEANFWYKKRVEEKLKEFEKLTGKSEGTDSSDKSGVIDLTSAAMAGNKSEKHAEKPKAERKSERNKERGYEDLLTENVDWEKISPDERVSMKERYVRHEHELTAAIDELHHSNSICPIGRDRTYRRYWVFRCMPGVFVEEDVISADILVPVEQTRGVTNPLCKTASLSPGIPAEDKSTNSDKENESFEQGRSVWGSGNVDAAAATPLSDNHNDDDDHEIIISKSVGGALDGGKTSAILSISVHEQIKSCNSIGWAYFSTEAEIDRLVESLNPRGYREGALKLALLEQKERVMTSLQDGPVCVLNPPLPEQATNKKASLGSSKSSRGRVAPVAPDVTPREALDMNLRDMLLDLEDRIYIGSLGIIKVKDRAVWRSNIVIGQFDSQCDDPLLNIGAESRRNNKPSGSANSEGEAEGSSPVSLVTQHAMALLQIQQSVEARHLQQPLGSAEDKKGKKKGGRSKEKEEDKADDKESSSHSTTALLPRWRASLLASESLSQVFLHLSVLEKSVMWSKSALLARCRICWRSGDGEHMLLCDGCDRGHHMYCLKPPVRKIPVGNWYCLKCRPKEVVRTPRKQRKSFFEEESETEEQECEVTTVSDDSNHDDQTTEDDDGEEEDDDEADDSDDDEDGGTEEETEEEEEEEEVVKPTKIKFIKGRWKQSTALSVSAESTPLSSRPNSRSSSRAATPKETVERVRGNSRTTPKTSSTGGATASAPSRAKSTNPAKRARHSIETERPSKASKRSVDQKGGKQTRHSLEPKKTTRPAQGAAQAAKRKSNPEVTAEAAVDKQQKSLVVATKCRGNDQRLLVMKQCEDLVQELTERSESWPFLKPVTRRDAPDYFDIVKLPMDFQRMRNKINKFEYASLLAMVDDIRRIFYNCQLYNMPTAPEYLAGQKMSRYFERRLRELSIDQYLTQSPSKSPVKGQKGKRK